MLENNVYLLERQMAAEVTTRRATAQRMHLAAPGRVASSGTVRSLLVLGLALAGALALLALSTGPAHAAGLVGPTGAPVNGADAVYALVHVCAGATCARPADWAPAERQLQAQFQAGAWGRDTAVVSRAGAGQISWAQWAAQHRYYIEEPNASARRNAIRLLRQELGNTVVVHIIPVPSTR
ncbi:MAG TPA: hypothetical protein VF276_11895 [Chloroflexia bacterium]